MRSVGAMRTGRWGRAAALAFVLALTSSAGSHAAMPPPSQDPFYDVPPKLGKVPNGKILRSRPIDASAAGVVPLQASAWHLQFKSLDAHDRPTAMVTTVLVPDVPWTGPGPRPIVSYQVAEDSADSKCAVSYALSGGIDALRTQSNAATETPNLELPLSRGWAVVAPDYQGPHSAFLAAPEEAHGVLDSLKAAVAFRPAGFNRRTPIGIWGYSGGGYATGVAALFQPTYAPKLNIVGAAMGAPAVSVRAEIDAFSGTFAGGAIAMGIAALKRAYPEVRLGRYLSDAGRAAVAASAHDCLAEAALRHPFLSIEDLEARPGILDEPKLDGFLRSSACATCAGTLRSPSFTTTTRPTSSRRSARAYDDETLVSAWLNRGRPRRAGWRAHCLSGCGSTARGRLPGGPLRGRARAERLWQPRRLEPTRFAYRFGPTQNLVS